MDSFGISQKKRSIWNSKPYGPAQPTFWSKFIYNFPLENNKRLAFLILAVRKWKSPKMFGENIVLFAFISGVVPSL